MNILYVSCHEVLEYDELKLLNSLGYNIRSIGAYSRPQNGGPQRGPLLELPYDEKHENLAAQFNSNGKNIHPELIEWADVVIFMHMPSWIEINLEALKKANKIVCYRAIGQSVAGPETQLLNIKAHLGGRFKIIRYSPYERAIHPFAGEDALIRFYKDANEFKNWNGSGEYILVSCQSASQRGAFCHIQEALEMLKDFPVIITGNQNEDLKSNNVTPVDANYDELKELIRNARFIFYAGTVPASYTLGFLEAFMTGAPILSLSEQMWRYPNTWVPEGLFEVPDLIGDKNTTKDIDSGKELVAKYYSSHNHQRLIDANANRILAKTVFSKEVISQNWRNFLDALN